MARQAARAFVERFLAAHGARAGPQPLVFPARDLACAASSARGARPARYPVGAQNVHWEPKGAFTGEISMPMVQEAGARLILVGHSERRHLFGETDDQVARKTVAALEAGLHAAGLRRRDAGRARRRPHRAGHPAPARAVLDKVPATDWAAWSSPTSRSGPSAPAATPRPDDAAQVHELIRFASAAAASPAGCPSCTAAA